MGNFNSIVSDLSVPGAVVTVAVLLYRIYVASFAESVRWRSQFRTLKKIYGADQAREMLSRRIAADEPVLPSSTPPSPPQ